MEIFFRYLIEFINLFKIAVIVNQYERGVLLRFGKFKRVLEPGIRFKFPLGIDTAITHEVVLTTRNTNEQSLTTKDGKQVVISSVVAYTLEDIKKILLEIEKAETVLENCAYGIISSLVANNTLEYVLSEEFRFDYFKEMSKLAKELGMLVTDVSFQDRCEIPTIRLLVPGYKGVQ